MVYDTYAFSKLTIFGKSPNNAYHAYHGNEQVIQVPKVMQMTEVMQFMMVMQL